MTRIALMMVALFGAIVPTQQSRQLPNQISDEREASGYAWVSANAAIDEFGFLRQSLISAVLNSPFGDIEAHYMASLAAVNAGEESPACLPLTYHRDGLAKRGIPSTVDQLVGMAAAVFSAVVVHAEGGFATASAGTMLELKVTKWMHGTEAYGPRDTVYVFYPAGDFNIGPAEYCASTHGLPPAPAVGDHVFMFPEMDWANHFSQFLVFDWGAVGAGAYVSSGSQVLRAERDLQRYIPELLRDTSVAALEQRLEAAVARRWR